MNPVTKIATAAVLALLGLPLHGEEATRVGGSLSAAGDYLYAEPRSAEVLVGPAAFRPASSREDDFWLMNTEGYLEIFGGTAPLDVTVSAPVTLPVGAELSVLWCYLYDADPGTDLRFTIRLRRRWEASAAAQVLATIDATTSGAADSIFAYYAPVDEVVRPGYLYWIEATLAGPAERQRFYGCEVSMKVDGPR